MNLPLDPLPQKKHETTQKIELFLSEYVDTKLASKNGNTKDQATPLAEEVVLETKLASKDNLIETTFIENNLSRMNKNDPFTVFSPKQERYQLLEILGEGGMGVVQNVRDEWLGREVALKTLNKKKTTKKFHSGKQKTLLWRIQQEAFITAFLEHPNIVPLYDFEQQKNGDFYFTMRKVEGKTFRQILSENKAFHTTTNEQKTLSIFLKVCDAVAYAHNRSVIHRDLKPENIMVGEFGEVYVMDWGIAKCLNQLDFPIVFSEEDSNNLNDSNELLSPLKTIGGIGTPGYMSPEQKKNVTDILPQSDIYALGRILRECYVLLSPLEEFRSILGQREVLRTKGQKFIQNQIEKKIPPDIQAIVQKATKEDYLERYKNVRELKEDLERYLSNALVNARKYTLLERFGKWLVRHKRAVSIHLLLSLILFSGYVLFKHELEKERKKVQQQQEQNYKTMYGEALTAERQADAISLSDKKSLEQKMRYLILGLENLNKASIFSTKSYLIQPLKIKIGKKLIYLACQIGEYKLANYIANDIQLLQDFVKKEQQRTLKTYHAKLDEWEKILKEPILSQWSREEVLLDIAQMQDEEIFKRLVVYVEEGTQYFLEENQNIERHLALDRFYTTMAEALGAFRDTKARDPLLNALKKMSLQLSQLPENKRSPSKHEYMITLCKSLLFSESKPVVHELEKIRVQMGTQGYFWQHSHDIYFKLVEKEKKD